LELLFVVNNALHNKHMSNEHCSLVTGIPNLLLCGSLHSYLF